MKKRKVILLVLLSLTIVTGCSQKNNSNNIEDNNINDQINEENKDWGVTDNHAAFANNESCTFYINFPTYTGIPKGGGLISYDDLGTLIIVESQHLTTDINVTNVDDVLPAYFEQTKVILDLYRNSAFDDFEFEITSKKHTTINGYEMCKYTGIHSFTYDGNKQTMNFVAYSAQLKTNGAYVYWMVLDETDDQSLSKTIDSHAYNMALSLREG